MAEAHTFAGEMERVRALLAEGRESLALAEMRRMARLALPPRAAFELAAAMASVCAALGDVKGLAEAYRAACSSGGALPEEHRAAYSNYLFALHYLPGVEDARLFREHCGFARLFAGVRQYAHEAGRHRHERLRVGYLSPDFSMQINAFFIMALLVHRTRERFDVYCYDTRGAGGSVAEQMRSLADAWRDVSALTAEETADCVHADEIDILVDLSGHAAGGRTLAVAAHRPAPVQMTAIGWFDTTGLPAIDYVLADDWAATEVNEELFLERPLRLHDHSLLCYMPPSSVQHVKGRRERRAAPVFGSFNNFYKITHEQLLLWREIVERVPGARLVLKNTADSEAQERRMRRMTARAGFAEGAVEFRRATSDYLAQYLDIDIALDTYPYPGGGTTCDALYMGTPVITRCGRRFGSRFGLSLLSAAGLSELAAATPGAYVEKAVALARDPELLNALHEDLRRRMTLSPLMDGAGYVREVEKLYEKAWQTWLQQKERGRA